MCDERLVLFGALALAACGGPMRPQVVPAPMPADAEVETTLYLIGDAGSPNRKGEPVFKALAHEIGADSARSIILFLGDNVYPRGLLPDSAPEKARTEAERRLNDQLNLVINSGVHAYFVPGNHDWARHKPDGWNAIRREGEYVDHYLDGRSVFFPKGGCPGPRVVDVRSGLRLVLLDSQWWLHPGPRPEGPESGCPAATEAEVEDSVASAIAGGAGRIVVVAAHHPLATGGSHGGYFSWKDHIFPLRNIDRHLWIPLPIIGSLYPLFRANGMSPQDLSGARNQRFRRALERAFQREQPLIYAAGHEHGLQVIHDSTGRFNLVSGGGIFNHEGPVTRRPGTRLALASAGYMRLDILTDRRVKLSVKEVEGHGTAHEVYAAWLTE